MKLDEILQKKLFPREILPQIHQWLSDPRILIFTGARQTGKTSLLYLIIQHLIKEGYPRQRIHYFDLEDFELLELCNSGPKPFVSYLEQIGVDRSDRSYVFIDEIQYLQDPSNFLKILADHASHLKIICTGSSSLDIRRKFRDSLVGRKMVFELLPLSFTEFLTFKEKDYLAKIVQKHRWINLFSLDTQIGEPIPTVFRNELKNFFGEYVVFGSYPAVVLEKVWSKKRSILQEIYQTYVRKDIGQLFTIANLAAFNKMVQLLAFQQGNLVNYNELATQLGISRVTVEKYIFILESTFVISVVPPFFANKRSEIVKMPKIYFMDMGLRNQAARNMQAIQIRNDAGAIAENAVYRSLKGARPADGEIKFWRSKHGNEVDFVIDALPTYAIEVKYQRMNRPRVTRGLRSFIAKYSPQTAVVVTQDLAATLQEGNCLIHFIPAYLMQ